MSTELPNSVMGERRAESLRPAASLRRGRNPRWRKSAKGVSTALVHEMTSLSDLPFLLNFCCLSFIAYLIQVPHSSSLSLSALLTPLSTPSTLSSHSLQTSPPPSTPTSIHLLINTALLALNSATSLACSLWTSASFSSLGRNSTSDAEALAGGMGRSLREVRRDAVSGNAEA